MAATERITMTMRELDRFKVTQDVAAGKLKPSRAAERLELTTWQVRRMVARLREHGPTGRDPDRNPATVARPHAPPTRRSRSSAIATPISARRRPARSCGNATAFGWSRSRLGRAVQGTLTNVSALPLPACSFNAARRNDR